MKRLEICAIYGTTPPEIRLIKLLRVKKLNFVFKAAVPVMTAKTAGRARKRIATMVKT